MAPIPRRMGSVFRCGANGNEAIRAQQLSTIESGVGEPQRFRPLCQFLGIGGGRHVLGKGGCGDAGGRSEQQAECVAHGEIPQSYVIGGRSRLGMLHCNVTIATLRRQFRDNIVMILSVS